MAQKRACLQASLGHKEMKAIIILNLRQCTEEDHIHLQYTGKEKVVLEGGNSLVPRLQKVTISMVPEGRKAVTGMERTQHGNFKLSYPYTFIFLSMYQS